MLHFFIFRFSCFIKGKECGKRLFTEKSPSASFPLYKAYPSGQFEKNFIIASSTDYPANGTSPIDICGIIEIGVNGTIEGIGL